MTVYEKLKASEGKAIPRNVLATECGMSDRAVRKEIEDLRMRGIFIANRQDGRGYYLIGENDLPALREQMRQMECRAKNILKQTTFIRRRVRKIEKENAYYGNLE